MSSQCLILLSDVPALTMRPIRSFTHNFRNSEVRKERLFLDHFLVISSKFFKGWWSNRQTYFFLIRKNKS